MRLTIYRKTAMAETTYIWREHQVSFSNDTSNVTELFPRDDGVKLMNVVEDAKAALAGLEGKLQDALDRRDKITVEIARASDKAFAIGGIGDQSAKMSLAPLNKKAGAIDAEIALLRMRITHAKRMLELAEAHAEGGRAKQAAECGEPVVSNKLFEVVCPDGRRIRQRGSSQEDVQRRLQIGYTVTGQIHGADADGNGGFIPRPGFLAAILEAYEGELAAWLEARGIGSNPVKITLPANGRENMQ
jgi:hypothetical protein